MVAGQRKNKIILQRHLALRRVQNDIIRRDFADGAVEVSRNLSIADPVFDVGQNPVLHVRMHLGPAMNQSYA